MQEIEHFYKSLYQSKIHKTDLEILNFFKDDLPKVSPDEQADLSASIIEEELFKALKQMKPNKSPGCDGLSSEFFLAFWKNINFFYILLLLLCGTMRLVAIDPCMNPSLSLFDHV